MREDRRRRHLESLFRVLPVDIREFYLQPVALCLSPSSRALPTPSVTFSSLMLVSAVPR